MPIICQALLEALGMQGSNISLFLRNIYLSGERQLNKKANEQIRKWDKT